MTNFGFRRSLIVAAALLVLGTPDGALAQPSLESTKAPPKTPLSLEAISGRIANVERLLSASSVARQIDATGDEVAIRTKLEAKTLLAQATVAAKAGRFEEANELLEKSTHLIFTAAHRLGHTPDLAAKKSRDFLKRAESVEVLTNALKRIGAEKKRSSESDAKAEKILARLAEARSLVDQGDVDSARELVDEAYETAKFAVEDLREGETVVRSLHFESAEDEYRYELGRNDTHVLLIKVLLDEKRQSQGVDSMVKKFMERSRTLRTQAEGEAEDGKFRQAISTLEDSTKELLRAIRNTGVYIPG
ncbi:MAG: hypothetical protein JRG89_13255 [Deltaproteobacteria bacterium]|nr:hypothetical protein [Deltaproteobacteria bacterium]